MNLTVGGQWPALAKIISTISSSMLSKFSAFEQASVGESSLAGFSSQEVCTQWANDMGRLEWSAKCEHVYE